jgi:hypothetical protein
MEPKPPDIAIFAGMTAPGKPSFRDLAFTEGVTGPVSLFQRTVEGPYLIQIDGLLKIGGFWVEVEVALVRYADGKQDYNVIPKANARSFPLHTMEEAKKAPTERPAAATTFTQQQFGIYKEENLAGTLTAHDAKGGGTLVVTMGHGDEDDVADDLAELPEARGKPAKTRSGSKPKKRTKAKPKPKAASRTRDAKPKAAGAAATGSPRKGRKLPSRRTSRSPKQS